MAQGAFRGTIKLCLPLLRPNEPREEQQLQGRTHGDVVMWWEEFAEPSGAEESTPEAFLVNGNEETFRKFLRWKIYNFL